MALRIKEINAKSIITKSGLPDAEYVINPYTGCMHSCIYCYARFMKRFTGHSEGWGHFVDVKINAAELIAKDKKDYRGKSILLSSVTDPYQPVERKYALTRNILEKLAEKQPDLCILTKSDLVVRDIDLLMKFRQCTAAVSLSVLDEKTAKAVEPLASTPKKRIEALRQLHDAGLHTAVFISPIFPYLSDWQEIIQKTKNYANEFWFENLNMYPATAEQVYRFLKKENPELVAKYQQIYSRGSTYWDEEEKRIRGFCRKNNIKASIYFHHSP